MFKSMLASPLTYQHKIESFHVWQRTFSEIRNEKIHTNAIKNVPKTQNILLFQWEFQKM